MVTTNTTTFKEKALQWANTFEVCCCLQSNHYDEKHSEIDFLIAVGVEYQLKTNSKNAFEELKSFYDSHKTYLFGFLGYDLKNEIENLDSKNEDNLFFDDLFFFVPQYVIGIKNNQAIVLKGDKNCIQIIENTVLEKPNATEKIDIKAKISKENYLQTVEKLKQHIAKGDIYEINFCQEFFANNANINPLQVYQQLNELSPTPFSSYLKTKNNYILSASPERFLCKRNNVLISQPIKGTAKRGKNELEDAQIKNELKINSKERAENIMIVDLVRNDLTKSALMGSVKVNELCEIYSFAQVHQMISTISCELNPEIHIIDAIKNTFPMGSMTGAPKLKAMELIEKYEQSKRGIYSGSVGYISPNGNFDFNVIIRSILYNQENKYLSFQVGSAITFHSNAEKEYEECLLKASAILKVLN